MPSEKPLANSTSSHRRKGHAVNVPWVLPLGTAGSHRRTMGWQGGFQLCGEKENCVSHNSNLGPPACLNLPGSPLPPRLYVRSSPSVEETQVTVRPRGHMSPGSCQQSDWGSERHVIVGAKPLPAPSFLVFYCITRESGVLLDIEGSMRQGH